MITTKRIEKNIDTMSRSELKKELEHLRAENKSLKRELSKSRKTTKAARKENITFCNIFIVLAFVGAIVIFNIAIAEGWAYNYNGWFFNHLAIIYIALAVFGITPFIVKFFSKDK